MTLTPQQWVAIAAAVCLLVWQFWPAIASVYSRFALSRGPIVSDGDQDVADLQALKQVQRRFERRGCQHAAEYIAKLYACFFDGADG
jgi:hypothetical protein